MSFALELKSVTKRFDGAAAVRNLTLRVDPGEIYGFIGPNGSGKTTTIKMIAGVYRPTRGTIKVHGFDLAASPTRAKRHLGYVPDDPAAYDRLTGREFLEFVGELHGMKRDERDRRIDALLETYGISGLADGYFENYSRGAKQKISFLAALLHEPALLLVDEPMVGLDPQSARTTIALLKDFAAGGGAVFLATHTLAIAETVCDCIGVVQAGALIAEGTLKELREASGIARGTLEDAYLRLVNAA